MGVFYTLAALLSMAFLVPEFCGPGLPEALGFWRYPSLQAAAEP